MPRPNSRAAVCDCGTDVAANAGYIYRSDTGSRWQVSCRSTACLAAHGIEVADDRPRLDAEGRCFFPYDPAAVAIIKALPSTCRRWDSASRCWDLSKGLEQPRFRAQVLDAVERIGCEVQAGPRPATTRLQLWSSPRWSVPARATPRASRRSPTSLTACAGWQSILAP